MTAMKKSLLSLTILLLAAGAASAEEQVLNIYSARHYPTDEALYSGFTKSTGIKLNRVDSDDAGIIARLKAEGSASPADIILLVDASRRWRGGLGGWRGQRLRLGGQRDSGFEFQRRKLGLFTHVGVRKALFVPT